VRQNHKKATFITIMVCAKNILLLLLVNLLVVTAVLIVPNEVPFGERIAVEFEVIEAKEGDYIGIYNYIGGSLTANPSGSLQYYVFLCGSQESVTCDAVEAGSGTVFFDGVDPTEEFLYQWPLNPGRYKVCHMRQVFDNNSFETDELIQDCKVMTVKICKREEWTVQISAFVRAVKNTYNLDEKIVVEFDAIYGSQNSWVGIYSVNNPLFEAMWVYTGCNNVLGDQVETPEKSNDCIQTKIKGEVTFDESNTGRSSQEWPLPKGEYVLKLQYFNNPPFTLNKKSEETFSVV